MKKKEVSSISAYSNKNFSRSINPFIHHRQDKKRSLISTLFDKPNNSNDSIINNSNNEIIDIDDDDFEDENFFGNTTGHHFLTPINETHRFLSSKNKFGKINVNSLNSKKIPIPKSKSKSPNMSPATIATALVQKTATQRPAPPVKAVDRCCAL